MKKTRKRRKKPSVKRRTNEAKKFNKVTATLIKNHWPDCEVTVYEEKKGSPNPDILVERNGLKIPIEVKSRRSGYFYIPKYGALTVCFGPTSNYERESFRHQMSTTLGNYGASLFLVRGEVRPETPVSKYSKKGILVLSNFKTLEESLEMVYEFLDKRPRTRLPENIHKTLYGQEILEKFEIP